MNSGKLFYFEGPDVLHLVMADGEESASVELLPNVTAEINDKGRLIGIEILNARDFLRDSVMGTAQARLLNLTTPEQ